MIQPKKQNEYFIVYNTEVNKMEGGVWNLVEVFFVKFLCKLEMNQCSCVFVKEMESLFTMLLSGNYGREDARERRKGREIDTKII